MAFLEHFDANKVDPNEPLSPVPAGTYLAVIVKDERKKTKNGDSELLELTFRIHDGPHKGRSVTERLNLWNKNDTAKRIAWGDMSAICRATGVMKPNDSSDLHNIPLEILVGLSNPDANGRMFNEINGYSKRGASGASPAPATPPPAASDGGPATAKPGWMS